MRASYRCAFLPSLGFWRGATLLLAAAFLCGVGVLHVAVYERVLPTLGELFGYEMLHLFALVDGTAGLLLCLFGKLETRFEDGRWLRCLRLFGLEPWQSAIAAERVRGLQVDAGIHALVGQAWKTLPAGRGAAEELGLPVFDKAHVANKRQQLEKLKLNGGPPPDPVGPPLASRVREERTAAGMRWELPPKGWGEGLVSLFWGGLLIGVVFGIPLVLLGDPVVGLALSFGLGGVLGLLVLFFSVTGRETLRLSDAALEVEGFFLFSRISARLERGDIVGLQLDNAESELHLKTAAGKVRIGTPADDDERLWLYARLREELGPRETG